MRLAIIAANEGWHVRDLHRAAQSLHIDCTYVDFRSLVSHLENQTRVFGQQQSTQCDLSSFDTVFIRTMPGGSLEQVVFRMDALHALESAGTRVINPPRALETAIDKYLTLVRLRNRNLPVPKTIVVERSSTPEAIFDNLDGDVVVKPIFGSEGRGISRLRSLREFRSHCEKAASEERILYAQRFVDHPGHDFRLLVLRGRILGCMQRSNDGDFITNVARGGRTHRSEATEEMNQLARAAAEAVGADFAGVDLIADRQGNLFVLEVNAVPGWQAFGETLQLDVARELLETLAEGV